MSLSLKKLHGQVMPTLTDEKGQGLVEYALILVLIALVVMAAVKTVGTTTTDTFTKIDTALQNK